MNIRVLHIASVAASFAAGYLAGVLFAPESGEKTRRQLSLQARRQLDMAESKLEEVESQLAAINERIGDATSEWSGKLRKVAKDAVDQHVPDLSLPDEAWDLDDQEIKRELRHIAR